MIYDAAVVGGGVMGMATAYALLKRGLKRVVVLERYTVGHDRAASTDDSKAIRYEYADSEMYSRMNGRSISLWQELEIASGGDLYVNCGVICWGRGEGSHAYRSYETVSRLGVPIRKAEHEEMRRLFPQFNLLEDSLVTINPEGGFLRASNCVAALSSQVYALGGEILEGCGVVGLDQRGSRHVLRLESGESVEAHRVALTVGAWGANVLPALGLRLPLTANKQQVVYISGLDEQFSHTHFPVFLNLDHDFYGFPLDANGLFKVSIHYPGPVIDPDVPQVPDPAFTTHLMSLVSTYIPEAARGEVHLARMCMYAMTPDEDFVLDNLPGHDRVVLGAGFSGHGFKFGPLIGELLAARLLDQPTEFPLEPFALSRFAHRPDGATANSTGC